MAREIKFILKCDQCGVVIGVYEPLVIRADGSARQTSLAAEPELAAVPGEHYHRSCYEELGPLDGSA